MKIAIDGSSLLWNCLLAGADTEGITVIHNDKQYIVNSANYGYEFCINSLIATLRNANCTPKDLIFVWEGMNSKAKRISISPDYKSRRGDRPAEAYAEFQTLKERLQSTFGKLGSTCVSQEGAEGDDTLAWLADNTEEDLIIVSLDNDMSVLNGKNKYGAEITVVIKGVVGENKYGDWPCEYITVYKAMVGDISDTIPGIKGFGKTAWETFLQEFGVAGLKEMKRLALKGSLDELVPEMDLSKMVARIVAGSAQFLNSYALAQLHPEWVNTYEYPIEWVSGLIKGSTGDERLKEWEAQQYLVTYDKWEQYRPWILSHISNESWLTLDIETSTPDESDEWIEAQNKREGSVVVDVIGSELTGMSLTFGSNMQYTVYIPVDHVDTNNVPKAELQSLIKEIADLGKEFVIQNCSFEGTVLYNEWGADWKDNGYEGFLPNMLDTKLEASYVNENTSLGLKSLSKQYFNYSQVDYASVTTIDGVQYKMRELSGRHVENYGCDDTICTASLHNFFKLFMQLEHTWDIYRKVEIDAMYLHTQSFVHGVKCDIAKCKELEAIDEETSRSAWVILSKYLIEKGWTGTVPPVLTVESKASDIKEAYQICTGQVMDTQDRKLEKLSAYALERGEKLFGELLLAKDFAGITTLVNAKFKANPDFNAKSPKQMSDLLYTVMGLPARVFNKVTPIARKSGEVQGSAKTDELAISYAKQMDATPEQKEVLEALRLIKMVGTRNGLYYSTYPYFVHWKTGRIHSSHNQCATNTRRASSSGPNLQQMPKNPKIEGQVVRFREVLIPHKKNAVIVSMDFASQELRVIADYSRDQNMLDCYIGEHLKDLHAMTGLGIVREKEPAIAWTLELFMDILDNKTSPMYKVVKECRTLGKKVNFTTEYGAMAPKLAQTMLISEEEAQRYIDAKLAAFPQAAAWKDIVIAEARLNGFVTTKCGAKRHLRDLLESKEWGVASKAERQAVNFKVQSSSAEMTKLAEGRIWSARLEQRFDCEIIAPIHDEIVASIAIEDLFACLPVMHSCMVQPYADMMVPVASSISFGPNFGQQIEIGEKPVAGAIQEGLVEYYKLTGVTV